MVDPKKPDPQPARPQAAERVIGPDDIRRMQAQHEADVVAEVARRQASTTVDGGKYLLSDGETWVDANGDPLKKEKD